MSDQPSSQAAPAVDHERQGSEAVTAKQVDPVLLKTVQTLLGKNEAGQESVLCHNLRLIFESVSTLRWTEQKPKAEGWYFYRWNPCAAVVIYEVAPDWTNRLFAWTGQYPQFIGDMPGFWAGPIKLPRWLYETEPQNNQVQRQENNL